MTQDTHECVSKYAFTAFEPDYLCYLTLEVFLKKVVY